MLNTVPLKDNFKNYNFYIMYSKAGMKKDSVYWDPSQRTLGLKLCNQQSTVIIF